jgi:glutamate N-acetyltransferase/amino-acid N-acetyltransferase
MADLHLLSPRGFVASGIYAGIKTRQTPDVGLLFCSQPATAAAVFTTNKVFAAPVKVGREHVADGKLRGVVLNSGNANACTGKQGEKDARRMCEIAAAVAKNGCRPADILPSSTGIIGHMLPMEKVERGIAWEQFHTLDNIPVFGEGTRESEPQSSACCAPAACAQPSGVAAKPAASCC